VSNKKIYVAGHNGMVGSAIVRRLKRGAYTNILTKSHGELDLLDQKAVCDFLKTEKPDFIFLAAAKVGGINANNTYRADFIYENIQIETNVIYGAFLAGIFDLCFLGSSCIYPRECPQPIKEEYLLTGALEATNEPYAIAKIAGIKLCDSLNAQYKTRFFSLMPTNLYGVNDSYDLANSHVLPALIRKAHEAKLRGDEELVVWGSGNPRREFLDADDLADACVFLMEKGVDSGLYNVGTGEDITIRELTQTIMNIVGYKGNITFDVSKPDGTPQKLLDVSRINALGWQYKIPLKEGIAKAYQDFIRRFQKKSPKEVVCMNEAFKYDVAIVGVGRVGLPLGLMLSKAGLKCFGIDRDDNLIAKVNNKEMPFFEPKLETVIKEVEFKIDKDFSLLAETEYIIITVGTPILQHIETDLSQINSVIDKILEILRKNHTIILRSTVAPKTTNYIKRYIEKNTKFHIGEDIFLSFCPERIAEGKAYEELQSLPQIIGTEDRGSFERSEKIFLHLTNDILPTNYISAELAKLYNNISRYAYFAIANQFALIADFFDQDIYKILHLTNYKYPRGKIYYPGFTAGTCLRKDFGMINETIPYTDMLLSAWKINEYMPKFLVENLLKRTEINGKTVAVLGYTFKQDADDTRDSLTIKLLRYLEREVPKEIRVCEPHLKQIDKRYSNYSLYEAISGTSTFVGGGGDGGYCIYQRQSLCISAKQRHYY
jgi:GDP-L-fucose synthase